MKYTSAYVAQREDRKGKPWVCHAKYRDPETGKWRQVSKQLPPTVKTQRQAEKALAEWRADMEMQAAEQSKALPGAQSSVFEYASAYIDMVEAAGSIRPSAVSDYRSTARRIGESGIGDVMLGELTPAEIQEWEAGLIESGKAVNTVLKHHRFLNLVYKHAVAVRDVSWNPCAAVKKPRRVAPTPNSLDAQTYAQTVATLCSLAPTSVNTAALVALLTGMRAGEICGLTWARYDGKCIRVEQAVAKAGGKKYMTSPKTRAGRRVVPVSPALREVLERRREYMVAEIEAAGMQPTDADMADLFICGSIDGRFLDITVLSRSWKGLAEAFDLTGTQGRRVTFHDCRHSFATLAIAAGADVVAVSKVLGHSSVAVTLDVYADALPEGKRQAVAAMGSYLNLDGIQPLAELASSN